MKIIAMTNDLVGDESKIPQDEDIRKANELFKDMFNYDIATGMFESDEVFGPPAPVSPIDLLKQYKDMDRNVLELRLGDRFIGPIERQFKGPMYDWPAIDTGVSKILEEKQRKKVFGEVATVEAEGTKVQFGDIPEREPYKAPYEGLDPEDPEDKKAIESRVRLETWMNELRDLEKEEGLPMPMRSKSLQEWMNFKQGPATPKAKADYNKKVRDIRPVNRIRPGQDPESVLLQSIEVDGIYYATPTLFPNDPKGTSSDPNDWFEKTGKEAWEEAFQRGELFPFDTEGEADAFARGNWKK